ncbi:MAG: hypothetical protein KJ592_02505, partial [Nanoarchaeota archaeon]|nr:hypothetical protein [Nanoarchaeota archaeon]
NEIAKKAEIGLSDALLKSISSSLSKEELAIADDYLNKVGGEKRFTATGAPEVIMAAFGYHRSVGDISTGMMDKLNEENRGIVAIRGLYKKGLTNAEISEIVSKDNKNRLAELYDLPIDSEDEAVRDAAIGTLGRLRQSIRDGLKNEDVNLIVNDGNGQLGFLSGEGYSDEEYRRIIQRNWRDSVAGAVTIENIALFTLPVAKLSAASELMKAKELKEVASVAGWAGGVVMKVPGVAKVGQGIGSLKTTIGGYRAVQYTAKNFPTLTKIGSWAGSEAVESGAGSIVEKFVPGGGLPTEIILGHSQALDLGDSIFKNMKKEGLDVSSISVGKKMMTKDGKLYHSLEFDSKVDLEKFMKGEVGWYEQNSLGTSTKDVAKNINVGGVESVVFESDNGVNIVATVKGMNVNKIDGVKVVAKSDMGGIIEEVNLKSNQVSEFLSERRVSRVNPSLEEILESAEGALTTGDRNVKIMALKEINDASRSQASRMRGVSGEGSNVREVFVKSGIDEKRLKLINQLEGEKLGLEDRVILESARIGESPELIRGTLEDSFTLSTFETGGKLTEETYEKSVKRLAEEGRASAAMRGFETPEETRERVKQLFLLRAKQDGLSLNEIKTAENSFDSYYDSASKNTADVSEFAGRLSNLDSMFPDTTTVHLVRDGGLTGLAHKVASPDADVRLLYVSRDTLKDPLAVVGGESFNSVDVQKSLEVSSIYKKVDDLFEKGRQNFISEGKEDAFYKAYEEAFLKKTIEDPAFALSVENTYVQLKKAGLLDKKELRFVDTCCAGNMNFYLEAIVKHYNPEIKTSTLLMESTGISQFGSGLKGLNVERANQRGVFGGFNSEGLPLIEKSATTTLSYVDELVVLESTINHMKKVDPDFLSEYVKGLGLVQKRDVVSQFAGAFVD